MWQSHGDIYSLTTKNKDKKKEGWWAFEALHAIIHFAHGWSYAMPVIY